ncbi:MAG: LLM class flavin-dependent oxidoreductase [Chloroflexi bacterium]|nr:LLM class flavin-dependent oxidoreductase [Chloroflexota bacterium]
MKVSLVCGAHYEGAEAHLQRPPVPPARCDPVIAAQSFDHYLSYAALADELGFDWVSVSEHHYSPLILAPSVAPLAGALTQIVKRARLALLGPLASVNNPVRLAEEIAMLDQLSHGRLIVLPLRGSPSEFNVYGPQPVSDTQPRTQEAARLIRKALSDPETFAWDGEYFHYPTVSVWPRAVQQPYPPMYFSGNSPTSAAFAAAEHLGVCLSFHPASYVGETFRSYLRATADHGWQPTPDQLVYRNFVVVADTDARADEIEANFLGPGQRGLLRGPTPDGSSANGHANTPSAAPGHIFFAGGPDRVVERIRAFHAETGAGVIDLIFSGGQTPPEDVRHSIELFGREVLPRIRELAPVEATA